MFQRVFMAVPVMLACLFLAGCFPTDLTGVRADGGQIKAMFYPGGNRLDDLVIVDGRNYFGKGQYQMDDPLADVGFRFKDGMRVQAECSRTGKDIMGAEECTEYTVYRSDFPPIPEGTRFARPEMF
ncbi:hypothetical protein PE067_18690 [Paracoccus sp. DMF-8]|uniref:hypothetical protein n=1 Tax=Paracoccus sp. DMF-8 TaxID=3019445 RepID=UPI0023E426F4|nr:hypothetical protein [Paracoccus sp. DMF-8]MDF3607976.1 hypothetical protein [Paracoccus sp. DMF-8]